MLVWVRVWTSGGWWVGGVGAGCVGLSYKGGGELEVGWAPS